MGGVQRDGNGHGDAGPHASAVHPGQAEAVEEPEAFHLTVTAGVAVPDRTGLDSQQQRQADPQEQCHYALKRNTENTLHVGPFENGLTAIHTRNIITH